MKILQILKTKPWTIIVIILMISILAFEGCTSKGFRVEQQLDMYNNQYQVYTYIYKGDVTIYSESAINLPTKEAADSVISADYSKAIVIMTEYQDLQKSINHQKNKY